MKKCLSILTLTDKPLSIPLQHCESIKPNEDTYDYKQDDTTQAAPKEEKNVAGEQRACRCG
jgi:hypothetical protein